jgi:hypothetical protein
MVTPFEHAVSSVAGLTKSASVPVFTDDGPARTQK